MGFWSSNSSVGDILGQQIAGLMLMFGLRWESVMLVNCGLLAASATLFAIVIRDKPHKSMLAIREDVSAREFKEAVPSEEEAETNKKGISFWKAWLLPG